MLSVRRIFIVALITTLLMPATAFPEDGWEDVKPSTIHPIMQTVPQNVVYNNGPVAGGGGGNESICLGQLVSAEKDMDKLRLERQIAVEAMSRAKNESHVGAIILWTVIGIAAGGAGGYLIGRRK